MTQRVPWFRVLVEGVVIVGSILLAFGIDAWWDGRQVDARRVELLHALEADFVGTRVLIGEAIASDTNYLDRAEAFLAAAGDRIPLSPDSIRYLSVGIVGGISGFTPSLINYNAARSSGEISLVQSQALRTAFADFDWYYEGYSGLADNLLESFYLGSLNDLRSELVTLSLLNPIGGRREVPLRFRPDDLNAVIQRPAVYAAAEPTYVLRWNMVMALGAMRDATDRIVSEIRLLLE